MMYWDDIRYFLAVARQGSLSAAARVLNVEHSTIGRRVDTLERALQVRLFDRLPRGWQITTEGRELLSYAEGVEGEALGFERAALGVATVAGKVRVSVPPLLASHFLLPSLTTFRSDLPNIDLELMGEMRLANLARRDADIALRIGYPTEPGLVTRTIGELAYGFYATPQAISRSASEWVFLELEYDAPGMPQADWLDKFSAGRRSVLRSNDLALLFRGACEGWGIAVLPYFLVATTNTLVLVPNAPKPPLCPLCLVMHADVRRSPRVRAVADFLADVIKKNLTLLSG